MLAFDSSILRIARSQRVSDYSGIAETISTVGVVSALGVTLPLLAAAFVSNKKKVALKIVSGVFSLGLSFFVCLLISIALESSTPLILALPASLIYFGLIMVWSGPNLSIKTPDVSAPDYDWRCLACNEVNPARLASCDSCGCPSSATAREIDAYRTN
jgi:hypothetical protein